MNHIPQGLKRQPIFPRSYVRAEARTLQLRRIFMDRLKVIRVVWGGRVVR